MKIDIPLVRQILLSIEAETFRDLMGDNSLFLLKEDKYYSPSKTFKRDDIIAYHLDYLSQGDLINGVSARMVSDGSYIVGCSTRPNLTFDGHDFIGSIRSEYVFQGVLGRVAKAGGSATLDIIKSIGATILAQQLGIS